MARLTCRGLTRSPWFHERDLTVEAGELVVVLGPNGSGKTLFLRALADLDPVDAGRVALDKVEREAMSGPAWRRRVLYVAQSTPRLGKTVGEDLSRIASLAAVERPIPPPPGLALDAMTATLSGGEAQRLALHRALALEPDVLLLDEVSSQLDVDAARAAEQRVLDFCRGGRAVVWISHDPSLSERVGARVERFG